MPAQAQAAPLYLDPNDPTVQAAQSQDTQPGLFRGLALKLAAAADAGDGGNRYQKMLQQPYIAPMMQAQMRNSQAIGGDMAQLNQQDESPQPTSLAQIAGSPLSSTPPPQPQPASLAGIAANQPAPLPNGGDQALADLGLPPHAAPQSPQQPAPQAPAQAAPAAPVMTPAQFTNLAAIRKLRLNAAVSRRMGNVDGANQYDAQADDLQNAVQYASSAQTPADQAVAGANPLAFMKTGVARIQPTVLKQGETDENGPGGQPVTAPVMGMTDSGVGYTQTPNTTTNTGTLPVIKEQAPGAGISVVNAGTPPSGATGAPVQNGSAPSGPNAGAQFFKNFILPHEGGLNPSDMNGSPTMYGFNQKANPDIDVKSLTPDTAAARFQNTYWQKSGAASMPPALAAVHADTYFINPLKAQQFLQQSGGDPSKYLALRSQWMGNLVQSNPAAAKYAKAWTNRNNDLGALIQQDQGQSAAPNAQSGTQVTQLVPPKGYTPTIQDGLPGQVDPTGKFTPTPGAGFTMDNAMAARKDFATSKEYEGANNAVSAANVLHTILANSKNNSGMVDISALDNNIRAATGLSARQGNVTMVMDHLGVPQEVQGKIANVVGNGFITPSVIREMSSILDNYADAHTALAQQSAQKYQAFANQQGFQGDLQLNVPQRTARPYVKWVDGSVPKVSTAADYAAIPSGQPYLDPNGVQRTKR